MNNSGVVARIRSDPSSSVTQSLDISYMIKEENAENANCEETILWTKKNSMSKTNWRRKILIALKYFTLSVMENGDIHYWKMFVFAV